MQIEFQPSCECVCVLFCYRYRFYFFFCIFDFKVNKNVALFFVLFLLVLSVRQVISVLTASCRRRRSTTVYIVPIIVI